MRIEKAAKLLKVSLIALGIIFCYDLSLAHKFQGTLDFSLAYPEGELNDYIDRPALGLGLTFGLKLGKSPLLLGVDLGVMNYGSDGRDEFLYGIPELEFRVIHDYNVFQGLVFLRFQPFNHGTVSPYIDALAGMNYFWTDTSIKDDDGWDDDVTIEVNYDDIAFTYGIGGGIMFNLAGQKKEKNKIRRHELFLDLRFRYIFGGKLEYLTKGSILIEGQNLTYLVSESRSDFFTFQIGLGINF
jgi:hypothetical protein